MLEPSLKLRRGRDISRGDAGHEAVVEAPIDAGDERRRAVDVVAHAGARSRGAAELIRAARPEIGVAEGEARDAFGPAPQPRLAERAAGRDEAVLHGLREHARRVEAKACILREVLRARGERGWIERQGRIERVRCRGVGRDARLKSVIGRGDAREAARERVSRD